MVNLKEQLTTILQEHSQLKQQLEEYKMRKKEQNLEDKDTQSPPSDAERGMRAPGAKALVDGASQDEGEINQEQNLADVDTQDAPADAERGLDSNGAQAQPDGASQDESKINQETFVREAMDDLAGVLEAINSKLDQLLSGLPEAEPAEDEGDDVALSEPENGTVPSIDEEEPEMPEPPVVESFRPKMMLNTESIKSQDRFKEAVRSLMKVK